MPANKEVLEQLIIEAASLLDDELFKKWMSLCAAGFEYKITAHSPEIGQRMEWWHQDKATLEVTLANVNEHVRAQGKIKRHLAPIRLINGGDQPRTESSVVLWHTDLQGVTQLYAVGRYIDDFVVEDGTMRFGRREVALETRRLPFGSHAPL